MAHADISASDDFAARLLLALQACNLSRTQLASILGVHKSLVSRWLSGEMKPTNHNLARISAEIAKRRSGFNMSLWRAPPTDFEAALGLPAASQPESELTAPTPLREGNPQTAAESFRTETSVITRHRNWAFSAFAGAIVVAVLAIGFPSLRNVTANLPTPQDLHLAGLPAPSVAVLPFLNMSGDPAKEYLGDGFAEEILNDLANTPNLRVAARTSSFSFKGKNADIGEIARKLKVGAVLEGSVRQQGDRLRVVAQLINAADGFHLWSEAYDRKLNDILVVQDEIARAIVAALTQKLIPPRPRRTIQSKAYQDYLQAKYFFSQRTGSGYYLANELLKDAIARQPDFAAAYALRGHVLMFLGGDDRELQAESQQMTEEAFRLEPDNQEALDTDLQRAIRDWDWNRVERDGYRILASEKRNALAYNGIGFLFQNLGFPQEALRARREASELDPLYFSYRNNLATGLWHTGRTQEAIAAAEAALELQPDHPAVLDELCTLNARIGKLDRARDYARQLADQHTPSMPVTDSHGNGRQRAIQRVLLSRLQDCEVQIAFETQTMPQVHALLDRTSPEDTGASTLALLYARTGDLVKAMSLFSQAYDKRESALIWIRFDAATPKALLDYPAWKALWRRPLLEDWQRHHDSIAARLSADQSLRNTL